MCNVDSQAKVKLLKVSEPLTDNADGNTEPNTLEQTNEVCAETRQGVCIKCGGNIPQSKYKNAKYCSDRCRNSYNAYKHAVKIGKITSPGVGSGNGNNEKPTEELCPEYACRRARKLLPKACNRCGNTSNLVAHHIDHDRTNNKLENFEILCKGCHQEHHAQRDDSGRYTKV